MGKTSSAYSRDYYLKNKPLIAVKAKVRYILNRDEVAARAYGTEATRPRPDVCEICGSPPSDKRALCFDHCHETGDFRGWICIKCNVVLGHVKDDPKILDALAAYLRKHGYE